MYRSPVSWSTSRPPPVWPGSSGRRPAGISRRTFSDAGSITVAPGPSDDTVNRETRLKKFAGSESFALAGE
ncbi:Uncharacterised protein [Mycobacteroides abscessus]|nr:Uncharacterised protein [Mycobacteroides abscessus]